MSIKEAGAHQSQENDQSNGRIVDVIFHVAN